MATLLFEETDLPETAQNIFIKLLSQISAKHGVDIYAKVENQTLNLTDDDAGIAPLIRQEFNEHAKRLERKLLMVFYDYLIIENLFGAEEEIPADPKEIARVQLMEELAAA